MRTLVAATVISAALLYAQANRDLRLAQTRSINGTVSDVNGRPIAEARIDHSDHRGAVQTDAGGSFSIETRAPTLVIRKAGYRSQWLRTSEISKVQITLQPENPTPQIRACSRSERCESISGWGAHFCFPRVPGVKAGHQGRDIDYGIRGYGIRHTGIMHGSGPNWSFGLPVTSEVWQSTEYQENVFGTDPFITIDARGRTADGKLWRSLSEFGESASYRDANEADARLLDGVLDGVCIRPQR